MKFKDLEKDLEGDIRNKLCFPRAVLERILMKDKYLKWENIEKTIKSIDKIPLLVTKWFKKFENEQN